MIGVFLGAQNSGKTLSMTYYAFKYFQEGYKIFSNYNLNFSHTKLTKDLLVEHTKSRTQLNKAIFLVDEIYIILDARSFSGKLNKLFSYFILQTSKRDVHLFGTAQYFNTVDKRFRENTNFMVFCNRYELDNNIYKPITNKGRIINSNNLYIKNSFMIKSNDSIFPNYENKNYYLKASPIFKLYDTRELLGVE